MPSLAAKCSDRRAIRHEINKRERSRARRIGRRMAKFTELELLDEEDKGLMIALFNDLPIPEIAKKFETTPATVMMAIMGNL